MEVAAHNEMVFDKEVFVITRIWHGTTQRAQADEYLNLMRTVAIPDYRATPGNHGAYALRRMEGDIAHFLMITFWESEDAIRAFAGDITLAKYYPFDTKFLLAFEPFVTHYDMYDQGRVEHPCVLTSTNERKRTRYTQTV